MKHASTSRDIATLIILPVFYILLHVISRNISLMFDDNLLMFAGTYNVIQTIGRGEFPLWDPYLYTDQIRAGFTSILYFPHTLFYLIAGGLFAGKVELIRHVWLALHMVHVSLPAITMYFFLRSVRLSNPAALVGGMVYGWNLYVTIMGGIYTGHLRMVHFASIPLLWMISINALSQRKLFPFLLNGLLIGWCILAGGLQPIVYTVPPLLIFILIYDYYAGDHKAVLAFRIKACALMMLASYITLIPLLHTAPDIMPQLNRNFTSAYNTVSLLGIGEFFCGIVDPFYSWRHMTHLPWSTARYFGFLPIMLAFFGMMAIPSIGDRQTKFFAKVFLLIFVIFLVFCAGYGYFPKIVMKLLLFESGFNRFPFKSIALVLFALAFFAALGTDMLVKSRSGENKNVQTAFYLAGAIGSGALIIKFIVSRGIISGMFPVMLFHLTAIMSVAIFLLSRKYQKLSKFFICILLVDLGLTGTVYCLNNYKYYGIEENRDWYNDFFKREKEKAIFDIIPPGTQPFKTLIIHPPHKELTGQTNRYYRLAHYYYQMKHLYGYEESIGIHNMKEAHVIPNIISHTLDLRYINHQIFDILGVKYFFISPKDLIGSGWIKVIKSPLIRNPDTHDYLTFFDSARFFDGRETLTKALIQTAESSAKNKVFFAKDQMIGQGDIERFKREDIQQKEKTPARIKKAVFKSNEIKAEVSLPYAKICVLAEPWLPPWKAYIDEKETTIYLAYGMIQAIIVPAGEHKIRFEYTFPYYLIAISFSFQLIVLLYLAKRLVTKKGEKNV